MVAAVSVLVTPLRIRYKDQMAEVKGFLVADPRDGISVTSLASLSSPCP
jgi:hypothetical protein